jgi:hypothetical protein
MILPSNYGSFNYPHTTSLVDSKSGPLNKSSKHAISSFFMKWFLKLIPIILLLGFISISPKTRILIGTSFDYLSKFVLGTVKNENKDKWLIDKPEWFNRPQEFDPASY